MAIVALLFLVLHASLIVYSFKLSVVEISILSIVCIVTGVSFMKYKGKLIKTIFVNSFLYYVYSWARGSSVFFWLNGGNMRKRTR